MKSKDMFKIIKETLERLENNAQKCLEEKDIEHAKEYMDYADGVRSNR